MWSSEGSPGVVSLIGPPIGVMACVFILFMLPSAVLTVLAAWTLGSIPVGVLIGHCALSEE